MGANVGTGSVVKNSVMTMLHSSGFSTSKPWEVPGTTDSSASGQAPVQIDSVLQADFVVIGDHDERAACDLAQVVVREGGLVSVHRVKLGDDHVVVADSVG